MIGSPVALEAKPFVGRPVPAIGGATFPTAEVVRRTKPLVETQKEGYTTPPKGNPVYVLFGPVPITGKIVFDIESSWLLGVKAAR